MKKVFIFIIAAIILSFAAGIFLYPSMPEMMASHWNIRGEVDSYMPKFWAIFLLPIATLACLGLFVLLPKIDPLKKNIEKFRKHYDMFILMFVLFMVYIYALTLLWHIGFRFNMGQMMAPALAVLFFFIGIMTQHAKRNWFIGIRTPWTISSDKVWEKTHQAGGKLFKIAGIIALLGIVFPDQAIWLILVPVFFAAIYSIVYSYIEYQKETSKKKR